MHSVPVPINVRCYSDSAIIVRRSEVTLRANRRHLARLVHTRTIVKPYSAGPSIAKRQPKTSLSCLKRLFEFRMTV
jgi:hypothetical protein